MIKKLSYVASVLLCTGTLAAQVAPPFIDFSTFCVSKPFNSVEKQYNIWEQIDHSCPADRSDAVLKVMGSNSPKQSQSHLEAMAAGNARIFMSVLSPVQTQMLYNKNITDENRRGTVACLMGFNANEIFLRKRDRDYFDNLSEQILYTERFSEKMHDYAGIGYHYHFLKNNSDIKLTLDDSSRIGLILAVRGGHSLGKSIYIDNNITEMKEYEDLIAENIDKLKGITPLVDNTDKYLRYPVLFVSLASRFENGITGSCQTFSDAQQNLLAKNKTLDTDITKLGQSVIKRLTSVKKGYRILIDVARMSIPARKWYYKFMDSQQIQGQDIPGIAAGVGISGLSWDDPIMEAPDNDEKNKNSWLNLWRMSLGREDILRIVSSHGIIALSLDEFVLGGAKYQQALEKTLQGTSQRRSVQIKLLVANMLRTVEISGIDGWSSLAIGSGFDDMTNYMDSYSTGENFPELARDLRSFFEAPEDVFDLYTARRVKELMYELSAEVIVRKVMSQNALTFLQENLGIGAAPELPPPSLAGNTTFRLKGNEDAKVVCLAGEFNEWLPNKILFGKEGNEWVCRLDIKKGTYQYKFIIDGKWVLDPGNPNKLDDGNGNVNSIITVK